MAGEARLVKLFLERIDEKVDNGLAARGADNALLVHKVLRAQQLVARPNVKHALHKVAPALKAREAAAAKEEQ